MPYGEPRREAWRKLNRRIGAKNRDLIDACDLALAVLDGVDVDSGTAAEIGYAFAKSKPILGYRGDFRLSADNDGAIVNLQVEYFIRASGGTIIGRMDELAAALSAIKP
jgi:nucleoside 2-deoxyribosyltransferase